MLPYHPSPTQPILFVNHHNFGDGLLQLGALRARQNNAPHEVMYFTAGDLQNATWLRDVVSDLDWLEWWHHSVDDFPGPIVDFRANGARTLRATWATLAGVHPQNVVPVVSSGWCESNHYLPKTLICCPDAVTNPCKSWPNDLWEELVQVAALAGYACFSMASNSCEPLAGCRPLHGISVRDAASWLATAELVVTVDTGLKWLAWATGQRRIVEVYNPDANGSPWSELGPPWTLDFANANSVEVWKLAQRLAVEYASSRRSVSAARQGSIDGCPTDPRFSDSTRDFPIISAAIRDALADLPKGRILELTRGLSIHDGNDPSGQELWFTISLDALNSLPAFLPPDSAKLWLEARGEMWDGQPLDAILLADSFECLKCPEEQLASLARLLRDDGLLILAFSNSRSHQHIDASLSGQAPDESLIGAGPALAKRWYGLSEVSQLLHEEGFSIVTTMSLTADDFTMSEALGPSGERSLAPLGLISLAPDVLEELRASSIVIVATRPCMVRVAPRDTSSEPIVAPLLLTHFDSGCSIYYAALHQATDVDAYLRKVFRRLPEDGTAVITVPNGQYASAIRQFVAGKHAGPVDSVPVFSVSPGFSRRTLERLLYRNGLEITRIDSVTVGSTQLLPSAQCNVNAPLDPKTLQDLYSPLLHVECRRRNLAQFGKTSIVMLTHNQLEFTRRCLATIRKFTPEPHELILVDNDSSDGTREFLAGQADIRLVANNTNLGFAAGCNQGIQVATGENILLLNNDTLVTTGWLHRLLRALHDAPSIGLVGPSTNNTVGIQKLALPSPALRELDRYAWEWGREHDGKWFDTFPLIGFCLLFRRQLPEEIGLLDERFGIGTWEDYDFCRRAVEAGYRCVYAADSYVYHFGSATFSTLGSALDELLAENQAKYFHKWHEQPSTSSAMKGR